MTSTLVFRPVTRGFGSATGTTAAFVWSGLLHEPAISVPVGTGHGGPTAYFLLQLLGLATERRAPRLLQRPWRRALVLAWLVAPLPLLFHPAFVERVLFPLGGLEPAP